jgi:hypothetical protein
MLIDLLAKLTQGNEMPNGVEPRPVGVTILIGDDDIGKTVCPRLEVAGAQMCLVDILLDVEEVEDDGATKIRPIRLIEDISLIRHKLLETGAEVLLVDPLLAFFGSHRDTNSVSDVAEGMYRLKTLAEETEVCVLLNTWEAKNATGRRLSRLLGSVGFAGVVRAAFTVAEDPINTETMVLACSKMNIARVPVSQAFKVSGTTIVDPKEGEIETAKVDWLGATDLRADDLAPKQETRKGAASAWLVDTLSDGGVERDELIAAGKAQGFSESTLARARQEIGVVPERTQDFPSKTVWRLPDKGGEQH